MLTLRKVVSWMILLGVFGANSSFAEVIIIQYNSMNYNCYGSSGRWVQSTAHYAGPGGVDVAVETQYMGSNDSTATITPVLTFPGGTYKLDCAVPNSPNIPSDLRATVTASGCTNLPETTLAFNNAQYNLWKNIGTLVCDPGVNTPVITIGYSPSNTLPAGDSSRLYACVFRLTSLCCDNIPVVSVVGTLVAGQTVVDVSKATNGAGKITVYANGVAIGAITNGIVTNAVNHVPVRPLARGEVLTATQTVGGYEGEPPISGLEVGGGPNPRVRVNFVLKYDSKLTGPVGTNGGTLKWNENAFILGAAGPTGGFWGGYVSPPTNGNDLVPSACWQTITAQKGVDPQYAPYMGVTDPGGRYGVFAGLLFSMLDEDSGPYEIYVDNIVNGTNVIELFETGTNIFCSLGSMGAVFINAGSTVSFSSTNADTGHGCAVARWQFISSSNSCRVFLPTIGWPNPNPVIDLTQPISARILLLPRNCQRSLVNVAQSPAKISRSVNGGIDVSWRIVLDGTATGSGPFSYQWFRDTEVLSNGWSTTGGLIAGATSSMLTLSCYNPFDSAFYHVEVQNGGECGVVSSVPTFVNISLSESPFRIGWHGSQLEVVWPFDYVLQSTTNLLETNTAWTDVPGAFSPFLVPTNGGVRAFYRLRGN